MLKIKYSLGLFYKIYFCVIFGLLLFGCAAPNRNYDVFKRNAAEIPKHDVWLTVSGAGRTLENAKEQALRDAIMQSYGAFVSASTQVINDKLISDDIRTVTQGIIQSCSVVSDNLMADGTHSCVFRVNLSVGGLIASFKNTSNGAIDFNGSDFVFNIKQQQLNESNEVRAISDIVPVVSKLSADCFDYKIKVGPKSMRRIGGDDFELALEVVVTANSNADIIIKYMTDVIRSLELSGAEVRSYKNISKQVYPVYFSYLELSLGHKLRTVKAQSDYNNIVSSIFSKNSNFVIVEKSTGNKMPIISSKLDPSFSHSLLSAMGDYIYNIKGGSIIGKYLIKIRLPLKEIADITGYAVVKT